MVAFSWLDVVQAFRLARHDAELHRGRGIFAGFSGLSTLINAHSGIERRSGKLSRVSARESRGAAVNGLLDKKGVEMMKQIAAAVFALGIVTGVGAHGRDDLLARFAGGIGVIPVASSAGAVNPDGTFPNVKSNIVRGVSPGAGPWRIADLKADVDIYGRIDVRGRGLLLASSNSIGQNANQKVFATLICEATAPFVEHSTALTGVPLDANGDFRIDDTLNPVPSACPSPVLLIRNTGGVWFAAGIPKLGDDN
jgi:hypothetical protein